MFRATMQKTATNILSDLLSPVDSIDLIQILVGNACNFAFSGCVFFLGAAPHKSTLMFSYLDMTFIIETLTALFLLIRKNESSNIKLHMRILKICILLNLFCIGFSIMPVKIMFLNASWILSAAMGIYIPIAALLWLRVYAHFRTSVAVGNIILSVALGSFIMQIILGFSGWRLALCISTILLISAMMLALKLKALPLSPQHIILELKQPRYLHFSVFSISAIFFINISFAKLEVIEISSIIEYFFIVFLCTCAFILLFKKLSIIAMLDIGALIVIVTVVLNLFVKFDLEFLLGFSIGGLWLFLTYSTILFRIKTQTNYQATYFAFSKLIFALSCGYLVGRMGNILCTSAPQIISPEILGLCSIVVAIIGIILYNRQYIAPEQLEDFYSAKTPSADFSIAQWKQIDLLSVEKNLGAREKEVLILILKKKSTEEIASEMTIANGTVKAHISHLYKKLNIHNRGELYDLFNIAQ